MDRRANVTPNLLIQTFNSARHSLNVSLNRAMEIANVQQQHVVAQAYLFRNGTLQEYYTCRTHSRIRRHLIKI